MNTIYDPLIQDIAKKHELPWSLVKAICMVESSFNPWAMRYELDDPRTPKKENDYRWLYGDPLKMPFHEYVSQKVGWGMMQIQGAVARELGFTGRFLSELCDPRINIEYGCKHLKGFYRRYGNWSDAIASYNAGSPRKGQDGKYVNQKYVDSVTTYWEEYQTGGEL